jgi:hypothetical protein
MIVLVSQLEDGLEGRMEVVCSSEIFKTPPNKLITIRRSQRVVSKYSSLFLNVDRLGEA